MSQQATAPVKHYTAVQLQRSALVYNFAVKQAVQHFEQVKCLHTHFTIDQQPLGDVARCTRCNATLGVVGHEQFHAHVLRQF